MKLQKLFIVAAATASIIGCASVPWITPPGTGYTVVNSRSYDASYNKVWSNLLAFVGKNKMQVQNADKENGLIVAELVAFDDAIADCGKDSSMQVTERRGNINILVTRSSGKTTVTTNNEFKESRSMGTASDTVTCNSKGVLEKRILDAAGS